MDPLTHAVTGLLISNAIVHPEETLIPAIGAVICSSAPDFGFFTRFLPKNKAFEKFHHGISHSIIFGMSMAIIVSTTLDYITGFHSFPLLFIICILAAASHLLLDSLIQNTGIQLLSPFSDKYFSMPILLGMNQFSTYAKCYKNSRIACFNCRFISTIKTPAFIILISGFSLSLIFSQHIKFFSILTLLMTFAFHLFLYHKRKAAKYILLKEIDEKEIEKLGVYVPTLSPYIWQGIVFLNDGSTKVIKMDVKRDKILLHTHMSLLNK